MNERVLLVDDDPGVSEVIGMLLERDGYAVSHAATLKASPVPSGSLRSLTTRSRSAASSFPTAPGST